MKYAHLKELCEFVAVNQVVVVGINGVEKEGQRSLQGRLHGRVVHQLAHALNEFFLVQTVSAAHSAQVLVPDLTSTHEYVTQLRKCVVILLRQREQMNMAVYSTDVSEFEQVIT